MNNLIDREAAIDAIVNTPTDVYSHDRIVSALDGAAFRQNEIIDIINTLPSTVQEQKGKKINDLISRKWLMECIEEGWIKFDTEKDTNKFIHLVRDTAPSVWPELFGISEHLACENMSIKQAILERIDKQRADLRPDMFQQGYIGDAAYRTCAEFIERMPFDQPDIIRCKECKHWRDDHTCREHSLVSPMMANEYCSRAERKEEED